MPEVVVLKVRSRYRNQLRDADPVDFKAGHEEHCQPALAIRYLNDAPGIFEIVVGADLIPAELREKAEREGVAYAKRLASGEARRGLTVEEAGETQPEPPDAEALPPGEEAPPAEEPPADGTPDGEPPAEEAPEKPAESRRETRARRGGKS